MWRLALSDFWLQTQVYKPIFPAFFSQFLDFFLLMFKDDKMSLCFLHLIDVSIHKQRKTQASWVSATDSYGEKTLPDLTSRHSNDVMCKQPIYSYPGRCIKWLPTAPDIKYAQSTNSMEHHTWLHSAHHISFTVLIQLNTCLWIPPYSLLSLWSIWCFDLMLILVTLSCPIFVAGSTNFTHLV